MALERAAELVEPPPEPEPAAPLEPEDVQDDFGEWAVQLDAAAQAMLADAPMPRVAIPPPAPLEGSLAARMAAARGG
jgi:hypothetical protein